MSHDTSHVWHDSCICDTSHVWHDSCIRVARPIHLIQMIHSSVYPLTYYLPPCQHTQLPTLPTYLPTHLPTYLHTCSFMTFSLHDSSTTQFCKPTYLPTQLLTYLVTGRQKWHVFYFMTPSLHDSSTTHSCIPAYLPTYLPTCLPT